MQGYGNGRRDVILGWGIVGFISVPDLSKKASAVQSLPTWFGKFILKTQSTFKFSVLQVLKTHTCLRDKVEVREWVILHLLQNLSWPMNLELFLLIQLVLMNFKLTVWYIIIFCKLLCYIYYIDIGPQVNHGQACRWLGFSSGDKFLFPYWSWF